MSLGFLPFLTVTDAISPYSPLDRHSLPLDRVVRSGYSSEAHSVPSLPVLEALSVSPRPLPPLSSCTDISRASGIYIIGSLLYMDPWHLVQSMPQYLLIAPSFTNILVRP